MRAVSCGGVQGWVVEGLTLTSLEFAHGAMGNYHCTLNRGVTRPELGLHKNT